MAINKIKHQAKLKIVFYMRSLRAILALIGMELFFMPISLPGEAFDKISLVVASGVVNANQALQPVSIYINNQNSTAITLVGALLELQMDNGLAPKPAITQVDIISSSQAFSILPMEDLGLPSGGTITSQIFERGIMTSPGVTLPIPAGLSLLATATIDTTGIVTPGTNYSLALDGLNGPSALLDEDFLPHFVTFVPGNLTIPSTLPQLTIQMLSELILLTWSPDAIGYVLEQSSTAAGSTWTEVPGVIGHSASVPAADTQQWFRLRHP